jgi:hypothetical protein
MSAGLAPLYGDSALMNTSGESTMTRV